MSITPVLSPLNSERILQLSPADAAQAAVTWLRRPNLFPGRALTAPTLEARQRWAAGRVVQRAQTFTPGVVDGLEVGYAVTPATDESARPGVVLHISPGRGLAVSGEDVRLTAAVEVDFYALPVVAPPSLFEPGASPGDDTPPGSLRARAIGPSLGELLAVNPSVLPPAGILVLQPVSTDRAGIDPEDPCDRCGCAEGNISYEDWRISDAERLLWYAWPSERYGLPGAAPQRLRNALAYTVFDAERALPPDETLPWETFGVPIALIGVDADYVPVFADRGAVTRQGGRARVSRLQTGGGAASLHGLTPSPRLAPLWQAQIEQFAEQIAEHGDDAPDPAVLATAFGRLPPFGLLPANAYDLASRTSAFFPASFDIDAVPVPFEQLDLAVREAAPMAPLDFSLGERVRILVPVSQASYEPRLLLTESIDPEFQQTLDRFITARARALGARQSLRNKIAVLEKAINARPQPVPAIADDPLALEPESLSPWGPPPAGGGHRSALAAGLHQHLFDSAAQTLSPGNGDTLYVWVYLDPDNPPRTLMLQWLSDTWEHRAYWGENLVPLGTDGTASRLHIGELPPLGQWVRLEVPAPSVGLPGSTVSGMAFTLYDGRAAFGSSGLINTDGFEALWFAGTLPVGAILRGDYAWEFLTDNDLWAPFEPAFGLVPVPRPTMGGHRSAVGRGPHQYLFEGATETLTVPAKQSIYVWVYLDPQNPPRTLMLKWFSKNWEHRAYWGENLINSGSDGTPSRFRLGDLPVTGRWLRLEIPVESVELADQPITGMAFTLYDGRAASGPTGRLANGVESPWFAGTLPAGAKPGGDYPWEFLAESDLDAPFAPVLGLPSAPPSAGAVAALRALEDGNALAVLSSHEKAQLQARGLEGFIAYLSSRADRADDLVDYGFVKVQTDIYRLRQLMLGTTEATRLAVSPALATIAKAETAVASQEQIADFLKNLKAAGPSTQTAPTPTPSPTTPATAGATLGAAAAGLSATAIQLNPEVARNISSTAISTSLNRGISLASTAVTTPINVSPALVGSTSSTAKLSGLAVVQSTLADAIAKQSEITPITITPIFTPIDVTNAAPLVGKPNIRTVSIADRLVAPKATEARDYTTSTRHETVFNLVRLADELIAEDGGVTPGLFSGIDVHGLPGEAFYENDPDFTAARRRPLIDFINPAQRSALLLDLLTPPKLRPGPDGKLEPAPEDEAQHFSDSADLADNTVALMRQMEGRIKRYRDVIAACQSVLDGLRNDRASARARLNALGETLAEARHDVAVTRALIAEEQARLDAINARRAAVLANEVRFLAYMRPRTVEHLAAAPLRDLAPGLTEAPVPACLRSHEDIPDELADMLVVVREAPASWFGRSPAILDRLDRTDLLIKVIQSAQLRSQLSAQQTGSFVASAGTAGGLVRAIGQVQVKQLQTVNLARTASIGINLAQLSGLGWQGARDTAVQVVSLGDLIDGAHGRGQVARQAAEFFDQLSRICTCLHAEFSLVPASIRLDWAEILSEFDTPPNLRNLASLTRWAELSHVDRKQMQAYVDWLFAQINAGEPRAEALMNDVVRMCLLLASHAPVGRIIAGRLPRPVTARPGLYIPLLALDASKVRVGMHALIYRADQVVARAVLEDVGGKELSAKVVHTIAASVDLDETVRVQFADAASVSLAASPKRLLTM